MQQKYAAQGFKVIAINVDSERDLAASFLKENRAEFTIGYDTEGALASAFQLKGMPSSYIIDRAGTIRYNHTGFRESDISGTEKQIQTLVNE